MILSDTHAHLYVEAFDEDRDEMIQRALQAGVQKFYLPAIDSTYTQAMLDLRDQYPGKVRLMIGLHPTHVKENYKAELQHIEKMLDKENYVAIGEIGIDLYWDKTTLEIQQEAFRYQVRLAKSNRLPIVIHCRESFDEIVEILEQEKGPHLKGIFHCFTGTIEQARKAISLNMKLGIGGVVTYKNGKIDKYLDQVPLENIVLETDAPYLTPVPFRGKRNESSYLVYVLRRVADIYGKNPGEVAEITTNNALKVFGQ